MQKKIIIGGIIFLIIIMPLVFRAFKTDIKVKGNRIIIDTAAHHIEGILSPVTTETFLLKDKATSVNTFSGNAFVQTLSYETAEKLRQQYGDFFNCNSPGAEEAMNNLQLTIFIANDEMAKKNLSESMKLVNQAKIPVVAITGFRVMITKQTYLRMNVEDSTDTEYFFTKAVDIVRPNYF